MDRQGLVTQNSGGMYKDCQRQKLVENVDGCRSSAMKRTRVEEEMKWLIMCSLKYNYEIK